MALQQLRKKSKTAAIVAAKNLGLTVFDAYIWQRPIEDAGPKEMSTTGTLRDGRPYQLSKRYIDAGRDHFKIECTVGETLVGWICAHYGDTFVHEVGRKLHFDGWYLYDLFLEPELRGQRLSRRILDLAIDQIGQDGRGRFIYGITETHYLISSRLMQTSNFSRARSLLFLKAGNWQRFSERILIPDDQIAGTKRPPVDHRPGNPSR